MMGMTVMPTVVTTEVASEVGAVSEVGAASAEVGD
jgi:hypothetical protein